jgi:hypothetical protein
MNRKAPFSTQIRCSGWPSVVAGDLGAELRDPRHDLDLPQLDGAGSGGEGGVGGDVAHRSSRRRGVPRPRTGRPARLAYLGDAASSCWTAPLPWAEYTRAAAGRLRPARRGRPAPGRPAPARPRASAAAARPGGRRPRACAAAAACDRRPAPRRRRRARAAPAAPGRAVLEPHARLQRPAGRLGQGAAGAPGAVGLGVAEPGMRQPHRQVAVGGEQQQALGVEVEAPDRVQTGHGRQEVEHRAPTALVGRRRHDARRLVQGEGPVAARGRTSAPSSVTRWPGPTLAPSAATSPSIRTRPASINASALRRLATPARAR